MSEDKYFSEFLLEEIPRRRLFLTFEVVGLLQPRPSRSPSPAPACQTAAPREGNQTPGDLLQHTRKDDKWRGLNQASLGKATEKKRLSGAL